MEGEGYTKSDGKRQHRGWDSRSVYLVAGQQRQLGVKESSCLRVQLKIGGILHLRLNSDGKPIANKYCEGKMKRTLKRESKEFEVVEIEVIWSSTRKQTSGHWRLSHRGGCWWDPGVCDTDGNRDTIELKGLAKLRWCGTSSWGVAPSRRCSEPSDDCRAATFDIDSVPREAG